jgi:RNA polymerase sigma factor for flagellar operon FliA
MKTPAGAREIEEASLWDRYRLERTTANRDALVAHYWTWVYKLAYTLARKCSRRIDAQDLAQNGFIALLGAIRRFDPRREVQFKSFAFSHVKGSMLRWLQGVPPALGELPEHLAQDDSGLVRVCQRDEVEKFLSRTIGIRRQILCWRHIDGLTHREVGERLGCPTQYAQQLHSEAIHQARRTETCH